MPAHRSFFLPAPEKRRSAREALCEDVLDALAHKWVQAPLSLHIGNLDL